MSRDQILGCVSVLLILVAGCSSNDKPPQSSSQTLASFKATPAQRATDPAYAYLDIMRSDLTRGKVRIITDVMQLSPAESKIFWPIYHDYEEELFALGDQRMELTRRFAAAEQAHALNDAMASQLSGAWFDYESQRLALVKKYHEKLSTEMSPIRAAQFSQIEHRVNTVVDLMIASELPLVGNGF